MPVSSCVSGTSLGRRELGAILAPPSTSRSYCKTPDELNQDQAALRWPGMFSVVGGTDVRIGLTVSAFLSLRFSRRLTTQSIKFSTRNNRLNKTAIGNNQANTNPCFRFRQSWLNSSSLKLGSNAIRIEPEGIQERNFKPRSGCFLKCSPGLRPG